MAPGLSDRYREQIEELKEKLAGVSRAPPDEEPVINASPGPIDQMLATSYHGKISAISSNEWIADYLHEHSKSDG